MKKHRVLSIRILLITLIAAMVIQTAAMAFVDMRVFFVDAAVTAAAVVIIAVRLKKFRTDIYYYLNMLKHRLSETGSDVLQGLPMPVMAANENGEIIWYNSLFRKQLIDKRDILGTRVADFFGEESARALNERQSCSFESGESYYTVYTADSNDDGRGISVYYFNEDTELKQIAEEYKNSRPAVALITLDNLDELLTDFKDSEKAAITGEVETVLEEWVGRSTGFMRKIDNGRFLFIMERRHLDEYVADKFRFLDSIRKMTFNGKNGVTIAMGIGYGGETLHECEELAAQALDMALGRGGDQVALRDPAEFKFFGGLSGGVERRSKVRTRVTASALRELISTADNVLIMGHRFGDLDSFGSSVGIYRIASALGKRAHIVTDYSKSLAKPLIDSVRANGMENALIDEASARSLINRRTLLIITDTHRADFVEFPDIFDKCRSVVVIDHHRKTVDHIDKAVIFYHEPYASSASEMVAELAQYIDARCIGKTESEALLAGIMLDTKNFVMRTGVRTFEAAGYLRSRRADPIEVKRLFAGTINSYKMRAGIVSSAELYHDCAISFVESEGEEIRITASQAADELLSISDVNASFVAYFQDGVINISARSMGVINVQVIMEFLGGGGHLTMAACQLSGISMDEAKFKLCEAIDKYKTDKA